MQKSILLMFILLLFTFGAFAQQNLPEQLPRIFVLGVHEDAHMHVDSVYSQSLLGACDYNIDKAKRSWFTLLAAMEDYSRKIKFPLEGVKVYLHLYCTPSGDIKHLGFLPLGTSRNVPIPELKAFFSSFARYYDFPAKADEPFKYNSKVSFPLYAQLAEGQPD